MQSATLFDLIDPASSRGPQGDEKSIRLWSYSRRSQLERCPRSYFYEYYGSSKRAAASVGDQAQLRVLKRLRNRHLRVGDIAHIAIGGYLKALQKGESWSEERLLSWARTMYRRDLDYSRRYPRNIAPDGTRFPPTPLLEFYYGFPNAHQLWQESEARLFAALRKFLHSAEFAPFRAAGRSMLARVEKPIQVKTERLKIRGKIDLGFIDQGCATVLDWKLGSASSGGDRLQLIAYAMSASVEFSVSPEHVALFYGHLEDGTVQQFAVGRRELGRAEARIEQDLERIQALDGYGRRGIAEAFTPCGQPRICAMCPYREGCPAGGTL